LTKSLFLYDLVNAFIAPSPYSSPPRERKKHCADCCSFSRSQIMTDKITYIRPEMTVQQTEDPTSLSPGGRGLKVRGVSFEKEPKMYS